jgi:hypothetical protein
LIILQLKSVQEKNALANISSIMSYIYEKYGYVIKGHEIQQLHSNIDKIGIAESANIVSSFCTKNEIDYLTYHIPILKQNIFDDKWFQTITDSISHTIIEAEKVFYDAGLKHQIIIVFHLTNFIREEELPISKEIKYKIMKKTEKAFLGFNDNSVHGDLRDSRKHYILAVENSYPKYFLNYATVNLFHPIELTEYNKYGIKTTLDLAHYQLYSNYLLYGRGNLIGDLERQIYGYAPSWKECIKILGNSLVQLHISDAKGINYSGEGLPLKEGEIPIVDVLNDINSLGKIIQGTIELTEGHLHDGKLQKQSADWLLTNVRDVFG